MTTFDLAEVRRFTAGLDARMEECDNGEGMHCANLDETLRQYATLCCEFNQKVRDWGLAIFYRSAAFDPEVEKLWLAEGVELYRRSSALWAYGQQMHGQCFELEQGAALGSALWRLERLLTTWVTPAPAISPLARHGIPATADEQNEMQERVAALPPLPGDWQPTDPGRRFVFTKLQRRRRLG